MGKVFFWNGLVPAHPKIYFYHFHLVRPIRMCWVSAYSKLAPQIVSRQDLVFVEKVWRHTTFIQLICRLGDPERCHNQLNYFWLLYSIIIFFTLLCHTLNSTMLYSFLLFYTSLIYCIFSTFLHKFTLLYSSLLYNRQFITCKVGHKSNHMVVVWCCGGGVVYLTNYRTTPGCSTLF